MTMTMTKTQQRPVGRASFANLISIWNKLAGADRMQAAKVVTQFIEQAPDDLKSVMKRALREIELTKPKEQTV